MDYTGDPDKDYLNTSGPDAKAYQQTYVRYVGGATWHRAGTLWRQSVIGAGEIFF